MNRRFVVLLLLVGGAMLLPFRAPAPLYYTPGEGWYYEPYGEKADWLRPRAKEQLDVAEQAFTNQNYNVTLHAAHRIIRVWPLSDYAPRAEYLIGRCLEVKGKDEAAFNAYEAIIKKYPHSDSYEDVLWRQYEIANRFLGGEWFRLWGTIPLYPSMDETAKLFSTIVTNGPLQRRGAARAIAHRRGARKAEGLSGGGERLRHRRRPLLQPAGHRRRRALPRRRRVSKAGGHRRIRSGHRRAGHRGLHGFQNALSPRQARAGRGKGHRRRSSRSRWRGISKSRSFTSRTRF